MPRVLNMHHPGVRERVRRGEVEYVGRPSVWGNKFTHIPRAARRPGTVLVASRAEAVARYEEWLPPLLRGRLSELRGRDLAC